LIFESYQKSSKKSLSECKNRAMGEVRKRKASAEGEQAKSPENVVVQKNG